MGIHHATLKRAEQHGVVLTEDDGEYEAHWTEGNRRITADNAKHALNAVLMEKRFAREYPKIRVLVDGGEGVVFHDDDRDNDLLRFDLDDYNEDDVFAEALEAAAEAELDMESEDDEDVRSGSVVKSHYKQVYKERGDPANCGDWFAGVLKDWTHVKGEKGKAKPNIDRFYQLAEANGVDTNVGAFINRSPGWQGRARMTGRRLMLKHVKEQGYLLVPDTLTGDAELHVTPPQGQDWPTH